MGCLKHISFPPSTVSLLVSLLVFFRLHRERRQLGESSRERISALIAAASEAHPLKMPAPLLGERKLVGRQF